jgi:hypothetical protein
MHTQINTGIREMHAYINACIIITGLRIMHASPLHAHSCIECALAQCAKGRQHVLAAGSNEADQSLVVLQYVDSQW